MFATALVTNETEETYMWLLEQFLKEMKGKHPSFVITDGDLAMRNAIRIVFPRTHHRFAWHLLRNALSHVKNKAFLHALNTCMLGDLEIVEFDEKWNDMITRFGLEDNNWVITLYERKQTWATTYIKGIFFACIRTVSQ